MLVKYTGLSCSVGPKYPAAVKSWRVHWYELSTMFRYPDEIRRIVYTTNAIENFNRQLRKVTKTKAIFVSDDALLKQVIFGNHASNRKMDDAAEELGQYPGATDGDIR